MMPERDSPLDIDDLPSIQANKDDTVSPLQTSQPPKKENKPHSGVSSFLILLAIALLALLAGLSALFYQQHTILLAAESRIGVLESKLNSTDQSLSKSSVDMQVQLVNVKKRTDELWTQMDKLWASAWRRNQADLTDQGNDIAKLNQKFTDLSKQLAALSDAQKQQNAAALEQLNQQKAALDKQLKQLDKAQKQSDVQLSAVAQQQDKLIKQLKDTQGWIDSSKAFRQQTNQSLNRLDTRINTLQKTSP